MVVAWRPVVTIAVATAGLLMATSARYGYHRDELYFLAAGRHLAWGYPDQPPFVALVARIMSSIAPDSLVALRVPSALAAAGVVLLTGLIARELGGGRGATTTSRARRCGCAATSSSHGKPRGPSCATSADPQWDVR